MKLTKRELDILRTFFRGKPVKKAYVFGSYARDEADEGSDLDILLELDYTQHIGLGFVRMKLDLEEMLNKKVDLVSERAILQPLDSCIDKDKIVVYERQV